jgi:DNA-binding transcriptional LysR family regulator
MTKLDLNHIALFARVVDAGSFTRAAKDLELPISSVSRGVAHLERALGARLLQRTTRKLHLTDAGKRFYENAHAALGALEQATSSVASTSDEVSGRVRLTLPSDAGDAFLAQIFAEFREAHPGVELQVNFTNRYVDLVEEGFDLALRAGRLADSSLVGHKIVESELALFAAPAYLERRGTPRAWSDLAEHAAVVFDRMRTWSLEGPRGLETLRPQAAVVVDSMGFLSHAVAAGLGIGLVPLERALSDTYGRDPPTLVRVLPDFVFRGAALSLLWPASPFIPRRVVLFRDHLSKRLRERHVACSNVLGTRSSAAPSPAPAASSRRRPQKRRRRS